jgi:hypothetical protein
MVSLARGRPHHQTSIHPRPIVARRRHCAARSMPARGRAGPVPWIHWRFKSTGISLPSKLPSRASCTRMPVRGISAWGSRKAMRCRSRSASIAVHAPCH